MAERRSYTVPLPDGRALSLGARTLVMAALNVTPDSFSDGGDFLDPARAVAAGRRFEEEGADVIDVGGESTRPGAEPVDVEEELRRVVPVVRELAARVRVPLSIDTSKAEVARAALHAGAVIVNDVTALRGDARMVRVVAEHRAAVILMHARGSPDDMYREAQYASVVDEVAGELRERIDVALEAGVGRDSIVLDPGLGFAKRADHSFEALARLDAPAFQALDRPWLVGPSRKSFLTAAVGSKAPQERDWATAAAVTAAVLVGAHIVRVHRVADLVDVVRVADTLRRLRTSSPADS